MGIQLSIIKSAQTICPLMYSIYSFVTSGVVPDKYKISNVIPMFKKGIL